MRQIIYLDDEGKNIIAEKGLNFIMEFADHFSLVVRDELEISKKGFIFLNSLQDNLIRNSRTSFWPGTEIFEGKATLYFYKLNNETIKILSYIKNFFNFMSPDYPEDICFYTKDGQPWLVTTTHERDLYLNLNELELMILKKKFPTIEFQKSNNPV